MRISNNLKNVDKDLVQNIENIIFTNQVLIEAFPINPKYYDVFSMGRHPSIQKILDYFNEFFPEYLYPDGVSYVKFLEKLKLELKNAELLESIDLRNAIMCLMEKFPVSNTLEIENIEEVKEDIYFPGNILFKQSIDLNNYEINVIGSVKCLGALTIYESNIGKGIEADTLIVKQSISNHFNASKDKFYVNVKNLIMKGYYPNASFCIPSCDFECEYLEMNDGASIGDYYGAQKEPYKPWVFKVKKAVLRGTIRVLGRLIGDDVEMYNSSFVSENYSQNVIMNDHSKNLFVKNCNKLELNHQAFIDEFENVKQLILNSRAHFKAEGHNEWC